MMRHLFLLFLIITLTACSKDESEHTEHAEHNDGEHHSIEKEKSHDDHDDHKDSEHHDEKGNEKHDEEGVVHLKPEQMKIANITVKPLVLENVSSVIRAPGEVKLNAYNTFKVSPRINAQVVTRHAKLGDEVSTGTALVTLSSVDMAEAQGQLLLADKEWKRVKKLGVKVVSARRYITAKVEYEKSYANAKAYGMNEQGIKSLLAQKRPADGSFQLVAQQSGRVLHDKFIIGEYIDAGYELMVIADEATMWVEARVTPDVVSQIKIGNTTEILVNKKILPAKVIQLHHSLDETTRTAAVRIEVSNPNDQLHSGMFVTAQITTNTSERSIQIPEAAVLLSADGDWEVMVEQDEAGEFKAVEVEVKSISNGIAIIEGMQPGTRVVTQGAFFVQSELAKGGFEIHNH